MSQDEQVDIFNQDGKRIGTMSREEAEDQNYLTENVLVFIFNSQNQVWTQLRSHTKKHYPGVWDISACGNIEAGEDRYEAALREAREEMNFSTDLTYVESFMNFFTGENGVERKRLSHLYIGTTDQTPEFNDEVSEVKAWDPDELRDYIQLHLNEFVPSFLFEFDKALAART